MNAVETVQMLHKIELNGAIRKTGHADYVRIFVTDNAGVSLGRFTIFQGSLPP